MRRVISDGNRQPQQPLPYTQKEEEEWRSNVLILWAAIAGELRCMQSQ